jgi:hypothetical protein
MRHLADKDPAAPPTAFENFARWLFATRPRRRTDAARARSFRRVIETTPIDIEHSPVACCHFATFRRLARQRLDTA